MRDNGYDIRHHSIIHGIAVVKEKLKLDEDYIYVVKKLQDGVFINHQ